jgi:hypothetical protein
MVGSIPGRCHSASIDCERSSTTAQARAARSSTVARSFASTFGGLLPPGFSYSAGVRETFQGSRSPTRQES